MSTCKSRSNANIQRPHGAEKRNALEILRRGVLRPKLAPSAAPVFPTHGAPVHHRRSLAFPCDLQLPVTCTHSKEAPMDLESPEVLRKSVCLSKGKRAHGHTNKQLNKWAATKTYKTDPQTNTHTHTDKHTGPLWRPMYKPGQSLTSVETHSAEPRDQSCSTNHQPVETPRP